LKALKMQWMIDKSLKWRTCGRGKMFDEDKLICVVKNYKVLTWPQRRSTYIQGTTQPLFLEAIWWSASNCRRYEFGKIEARENLG
jgi:hypothetical protein